MREALRFMKLKQNIKKRKILMIFFSVLVLIPIILAFMPIKMSIPSTDDIKYSDYFIVYLIPEGSTDSGSVICYDQDEVYYNKINFKGALPQNLLSSDIYASGTQFILYGTLSVNEDKYTLNVFDWDIMGYVNRDCDSLRLDMKKYITVFDLKWFDFLLSGN